MQKILFFDNWGLEIVSNLTRRIEQPVKHPRNPLFIADQPWEHGNMQTYGSVIKLAGRPFQLWYSTIRAKPYNICLCYAQSDDGLTWHKPLLDFVRFRGRKTNIVMDGNVHGPALIHDAAGDCYRLIAGVAPHNCISTFHSRDGLHWTPHNQGPVIANHPDCAMGLVKARNGQFAAYHRHPSTGRRVCRTTSWNFRFWDSEPRLVMEPDAHDPPQLQFYAMGSMLYGPYEIATLWAYHTSAADLATWHMEGRQHAELAYSRTGTCWHRAAQGRAFIAGGSGNDWDRGNLQCASQPVLLDEEIRYYFTGTDRQHSINWELKPHTAGLGMASLAPDRFIAMDAGGRESELLTAAFSPCGSQFHVNARVSPRGSLALEILHDDGRPVKGFSAADCLPIRGDSTAHPVAWKGKAGIALPAGRRIRLRVRSRRASLYSIFVTAPGERPVYHNFSAPF